MEIAGKKILTLCIVHQSPMVLLGMKKRGFGKNKWNGFGGKVQEGEAIESAAKRELREEAGLLADELEKLGILNFEFSAEGGPTPGGKDPEILEVHVFKAKNISGEPRESEEMKPQWFRIDEIPFQTMWPDDKHWFPLFLQDKKFRGKFLFDDADNILDMNLVEVGEL